MDKPQKDILIGFFIFVLAIALFYFLWRNNIFLTIAFLFISAFILLSWSNKEEKLIYFTGFVLGPIIDLTIVPTGIWIYGNPTIFRIPLWLPFTYGILTVEAVKIGKAIAKLYFKS